jgi:hypothetical protein
MTSAAGVCVSAMIGAVVVAAVGYRLGMRGPWVFGSVGAGLNAFGGAYLLGRAHEAARHERRSR